MPIIIGRLAASFDVRQLILALKRLVFRIKLKVACHRTLFASDSLARQHSTG
jgi:hypothetical protein